MKLNDQISVTLRLSHTTCPIITQAAKQPQAAMPFVTPEVKSAKEFR